MPFGRRSSTPSRRCCESNASLLLVQEDALEPRERHFVELYFIKQRTHREIADELGRSERTIERLHARVLDGLRRTLVEAGVKAPPPPEGRPPAEATTPVAGGEIGLDGS